VVRFLHSGYNISSDVFYVYILASRSHQSLPIVHFSLAAAHLVESILDILCSAMKGFNEIINCFVRVLTALIVEICEGVRNGEFCNSSGLLFYDKHIEVCG
jgi:hypothetical protein